jgi:opacity protein-like surface antigen
MEAAMRFNRWMLAGACALALAGPAAAVDGVGLAVRSDASAWSRWQGRLAIGSIATALPGDAFGADAAAARKASFSLIGDYYFSPAIRLGVDGGFRASGGVVYGARTLWGGRPLLGAVRPAFSVERQWASAAVIDSAADAPTMPYVGLGYSGVSGTGRFGVSADLGLVARSPGSAIRLGRVINGVQNLDDVVRELRLAPVLQLGVSYAF